MLPHLPHARALPFRCASCPPPQGVNKAVILGLVDELLSKKEVNIWWLPDSLERIFYVNIISLMLSVLDEVVEGMSVNFAGVSCRRCCCCCCDEVTCLHTPRPGCIKAAVGHGLPGEAPTRPPPLPLVLPPHRLPLCSTT